MPFMSRLSVGVFLIVCGVGFSSASFAALAESVPTSSSVIPDDGNAFVAVKGAPRVGFKDSAFPRVITGDVRFQVFATGKDLQKLTIHLRGPMGLPSDKDRHIKVVVPSSGLASNGVSPSGASTLTFDDTLNVSDLPPGRYIYYTDAYNGQGLRGRSDNRSVRIAPSAFKPRVMFDSDYAHILDVESPYNPDAANTRMRDSSLTREKIQAAFKEILSSGADTLVLSPGAGDVFYFRTKYYPMSQHKAWWLSKTGQLPKEAPLVNYTLNGGDPIDDARGVADSLRKKLFVSIRMNDGHAFYMDTWLNPQTGDILQPKSSQLYSMYSQFMATHLGLQIGDDSSLPTSRYRYLFDYAKGSDGESASTHLKNSVLGHKVAIIKGMLDEHRVDGVVLDLMRLSYMFNQDKVPLQKRQQIMKEMITQIRQEMDSHYKGRPGDVPQLFVRIPALPEEWSKLGVLIPDMALAGVDGFVFSFERFWAQPFYYKGAHGETLQRLDAWKPLVGKDVSFIYEMNYTTEIRNGPLPNSQISNYTFWRRTRDQMFVSGAFSAKSLGSDGFYMFNLPYYRGVNSYNDPETRVTPPFALFDCLKKLSCSGYTNQPYYFLAPRGNLNYSSLPDDAIQLPKTVTSAGTPIVLYAPPPLSGWPAKMRLRIEVKEPGLKVAKVFVNGTLVTEVQDVSEPYNSPFQYANCDPERTQAFEVPSSILNNPRMELTVVAQPGTQPTVRWVDLTAY